MTAAGHALTNRAVRLAPALPRQPYRPASSADTTFPHTPCATSTPFKPHFPTHEETDPHDDRHPPPHHHG